MITDMFITLDYVGGLIESGCHLVESRPMCELVVADSSISVGMAEIDDVIEHSTIDYEPVLVGYSL